MPSSAVSVEQWLARTQSGDLSGVAAAAFTREGYSSLWEVLDSCLTVEDLQGMGIDPVSSTKVVNSLESMTAQAVGANVAKAPRVEMRLAERRAEAYAIEAHWWAHTNGGTQRPAPDKPPAEASGAASEHGCMGPGDTEALGWFWGAASPTGRGGPAGSSFACEVSESKDYLYVDEEDRVRGPFSRGEMREWFQLGYFEPRVKMKRVADASFTDCSELLGGEGAEPAAADPGKPEWVYLDDSRRLQGPFSLGDMRAWNDEGFFEPKMMVKRMPDPAFVQVKDCDVISASAVQLAAATAVAALRAKQERGRRAASASEQQEAAKLLMVESPAVKGLSPGAIIALPSGTGEMSVGRNRGCDFALRDAEVSSLHATLGFDDGLWVVDHGSSNGTFVNGERLSAAKQWSRRRALMVGDVLRIGRTTFKAISGAHSKHFALAKRLAPVQQEKTRPQAQSKDGTAKEPSDASEKCLITLDRDRVQAKPSGGEASPVRTRPLALQEYQHDWYYIDRSQKTQGPFSLAQMRQWRSSGYLPDDVLAKHASDSEFVAVGGTSLISGKPWEHKQEQDQERRSKRSRSPTLAAQYAGFVRGEAESLIKKIFDIFDKDCDGRLNQREYHTFCSVTEGFGCDDERWAAHCSNLGASADGLRLADFAALYNDERYKKHFGKQREDYRACSTATQEAATRRHLVRYVDERAAPQSQKQLRAKGVDKSFACPVCDKRFKTAQSVQDHQQGTACGGNSLASLAASRKPRVPAPTLAQQVGTLAQQVAAQQIRRLEEIDQQMAALAADKKAALGQWQPDVQRVTEIDQEMATLTSNKTSVIDQQMETLKSIKASLQQPAGQPKVHRRVLKNRRHKQKRRLRAVLAAQAKGLPPPPSPGHDVWRHQAPRKGQSPVVRRARPQLLLHPKRKDVQATDENVAPRENAVRPTRDQPTARPEVQHPSGLPAQDC